MGLFPAAPDRSSVLLRLTALGVAAGLTTCLAALQDAHPAPKLSDSSYYLSCGDNPPYGSHIVRSKALLSPDGKHSAYVEANASWVNGHCVNASKVFVQNNSDAFQVAFLQEPTEMFMGNGIRLIDWSKDSSSLLFEVQQWQWGTDAEPRKAVRIYDVISGIFKTVPLEKEIATLGEGCLVTIQPLGFSETGEAVLRFSAKQYFEAEGEPRKPLCKSKGGAWIFDFKSNRLTDAPNDYQVQRWARAK